MNMKKQAVSMIRGLGKKLVTSSSSSTHLNASHAPVGMLDVERITRVAAPIATLTTRPSPQRSRLPW